MDQGSNRVVIEPTSRLDRKAGRYALLLREAFAFAQDRGRTDAGPLAHACALANILRRENRESAFDADPLAEAFWERVALRLSEGN